MIVSSTKLNPGKSISHAQKIDLFKIMNKSYNSKEIQHLCFFLRGERGLKDLDFDNLGDDKTTRITELIDFADRRGCLELLRDQCYQERSELPEWGIFFSKYEYRYLKGTWTGTFGQNQGGMLVIQQVENELFAILTTHCVCSHCGIPTAIHENLSGEINDNSISLKGVTYYQFSHKHPCSSYNLDYFELSLNESGDSLVGQGWDYINEKKVNQFMVQFSKEVAH